MLLVFKSALPCLNPRMHQLIATERELWDLNMVDPFANSPAPSHGFYTVNEGKAAKPTLTGVQREHFS